MRFWQIAAVASLIVLAACTPQADRPGPAKVEGTAPRDNLAGATVDAAGANGDAAKAAAHAERVVQLKALLEKLAKATTLNDAFTLAEGIEDLDKDVRPDLEGEFKKLPELPRIAACRALYTLGGYDASINALIEIVTGEGEGDTRVAAAEVIGALASERHAKIVKEALLNKVFDPAVKVQLAIALWRSARDLSAKKLLNEMLAADNESFRISAALALGEIGDFTESKPMLEMLADEPTLRGRAAKRMLEWEKEIKRLEALLQGTHPSQPKLEKIDVRLLDRIQDMIKERYIYADAVSGNKLIYAAANGMLDGFDPYTCLLEGAQFRDAAEIRRFTIPTLGLTLGKVRIRPSRKERVTVVLSVTPGGPADRAGLRPHDRVYRVIQNVTVQKVHDFRDNSASIPTTDEAPMQALPLDEAVSRFRGAPGTTLGLQFRREKWLLSRWVHLTHETPAFEPVQFEQLPGDLGIIRVHEVGASAPAKVAEAMAAFEKAGVKGVLLDLRESCGGSADAATQIAGLFLAKDTLVTVSAGRSEELARKTEYKTSNDKPNTKLPLVVIADGGTADAGEILAGALREHKRALVVGARTFGRALVQELVPIKASELVKDNVEAGLLLTVARFNSPVSQVAYFDRGVEADVSLTATDFEGWIYDELEVVREGEAFKVFMDKMQKDLSAEQQKTLAMSDGRKTDGYPGFDVFYKGLPVHCDAEPVRWLVRDELRARMIAAKTLANTVDLQEDAVFGGALREIAKLAGVDLAQIPEYSVLK
ncbi:MAG: hypothetical protein IT462_06810 [Planctomycetes bacterium]|nr:hypothetical protein [Planctomycetota bacterium]